MSVINSIPLIASGDDGYNISRSVRLRSSASAYFNRTPASAGNRNTWTWSAWVKRGALGAGQTIFAGYPSSTVYAYIGFTSSDQIRYASTNSGASLTTTAVYRDPSAWYHIVFVYDDTQATSSNRLKLYVNGVQVTAFGTAAYPTLNFGDYINSANVHNLGRFPSGVEYVDGYLTEINFIDGQALTPSSFGETDSITGVWKPKKYAGTYGTNGFYLNFSDNSNNTAATIGKDYSGNGNNWTPNNISVTSGVTYDSMLDVPTQWADGGNGRGNYATFNPLDGAGSGITFSNGNLNQSWTSNSNRNSFGTFLNNTGKWYFECLQLTGANTDLVQGLAPSTVSSGTASLVSEANYYGYTYAGRKWTSGSLSDGNPTFTVGTDVMCFAVDFDAGKIWLGKNGTWLSSGDPSTGANAYWTFTAGTALKFGCAVYNATSAVNFGQRPFAYTPPTGFKALNTQNLPAPSILKGNQWFDVALYSGGSGDVSVTGLGFTPDLSWIKCRNQAFDHGLYDAVRGVQKELQSNTALAETTQSTGLKSFDSAGFTVGGRFSGSGNNYTSWNWKESATAGLDIVTFTNPSSGSSSFAHNLGVKPSMIIVKSRSNTSNWTTAHKSLGAMASTWLNMDSTAAVQTSSNIWGGEPTSSVFYCGTGIQIAGATMVAYLFAEVAGFSRFGSYTGNGSADGPFVYCGFRPRWVMFKRTNSANGWYIVDTARGTYNVIGPYLTANVSDAEGSAATIVDILSNGFKLRGDSTYTGFNGTGDTYIYAAFAEHPFKNSLAR